MQSQTIWFQGLSFVEASWVVVVGAIFRLRPRPRCGVPSPVRQAYPSPSVVLGTLPRRILFIFCGGGDRFLARPADCLRELEAVTNELTGVAVPG